MKKILLLASVFALTTAAWSAPLTPEEALQRALDVKSGPMRSVSSEKLNLSFTQSSDGKPMIYMFSRGENSGFIAVAADNTTAPLLGFCDNGTLPSSSAELPDGMRYWLESLAEQAALNASAGIIYSAPKAPAERWYIDPLCKTRWNQSEPFNNLCPTNASGQRSVTGCVATAMAQVMKYYNYPDHVMAAHTYTTETLNKELSINESMTFDWSKMLDKYSSSATEEEKKAVATLMYACGVSVDMDYSPSASGAVTNNAVNAFITNFGYDKGIQWHNHDYYTTDEWEEMIFRNLVNYGPVLFSGRNNEGGHAFVCDGYNDGYYHFNWGWGGMSDGFFLLTALDPDAQGIGGSTAGYNFNQGIMTHVSKTQTSENYFQQLVSWPDTNMGITCTRNESASSNTLAITFSMYNTCGHTISGFYPGLMIVDGNGQESYVFKTNAYNLDPSYYYDAISMNYNIPDTAPDGEYTIYPVWKSSEGTISRILYPINRVGFVTYIKNGNEVTVGTEQIAKISASDFELVSDLYKGSDFMNSAKLTNTSSTREYSGTLSVGLVNNSGSLVAIGNDTRVIIPAGGTLDWEYISPLRYLANDDGSANVPDAGNYDMYLLEQTASGSYSTIAGPLDVTLHDAATPTLEIKDLTVENDQIFWMMKATATVKCTSGYFAGTLPIYIFPAQGGTSLARFSSNYFSIKATESTSSPEKAPAIGQTQITWDMPFYDGAVSTTYFAAVNYNGNWISNQAVFTTSINTAVEGIEADANLVTETEYITLTGISLGSNRPESGIYIVRERHADGSVTTRRIKF